MKLWNEIKKAMFLHPDQIVCEGKAEMTYEELIVFGESFAKHLQGESCCAILCGSEMAASMALLACFAAEVTAVPLSFRYGTAHCKKILNRINPTAIITDSDGELQILHISDAQYREPEIHPALIMCTSGTTGIPKGAMLTETNILTNVGDICDYLKTDETDSILIARPLYHCAVLTGEFLTSLMKGTHIRFYSETFNPKILLDLIAKHQISVFCGTPTLLGMMTRFCRKETDSTLRTICVSGECLSVATGLRIAEAFPKADIYHVYGLTEACPRVSFLPPHLFAKQPDSVGFPLRSVQLKIVKQDGTAAACEEDGILWVKGENVMTGYYEDPEQTARVLKDGWLCTGDLAVTDRFGFLKIKGRVDDLFIRAGMNIYPQEIESTLKTDPRVNDALVYRIDNEKAGVQIGLKLSGAFASADEVRQLCATILPAFQMPSVIELVDKLPKNGSGKIIRR